MSARSARSSELAEQLEHIARDSTRRHRPWPAPARRRPQPLPAAERPGRARRRGDVRARAPALARARCRRRARAACLTFAAEPEDGVEHVLGLLPEPFAEASCWWQATGSAGIKPGIRCRLWFWLSRPVSDGEAKGWLAGCPVDRSLFTPVALHYTAPPILAPGTPDPVVRRSGVRRGLVGYGRGARRAAGRRDDRRSPVAASTARS